MTSDSNPPVDALLEQLARSKRIDAWLYDSSNGTTAARTPRIIMSASSYQLAMDHHRAIIRLVEQDMWGSALALLRPYVEAYTWGAWLHHYAKDKQLDQILAHRFTRNLDGMQRDLNKIKFFDSSIAKDTEGKRRNLHGFTHGGILHMQWRFKDGEVRPGHPPEVVADGLRIADVHGYLALQGVVALAEDQEKAVALHAKVYDIFEWRPST